MKTLIRKSGFRLDGGAYVGGRRRGDFDARSAAQWHGGGCTAAVGTAAVGTAAAGMAAAGVIGGGWGYGGGGYGGWGYGGWGSGAW